MKMTREKLILDFLKKNKNIHTATFYSSKNFSLDETQKALLIHIYQEQLYCLAYLIHHQTLCQLIKSFPDKIHELNLILQSVDKSQLKNQAQKIERQIWQSNCVCFFSIISALALFVTMIVTGPMLGIAIALIAMMLSSLISAAISIQNQKNMNVHQKAIASIDNPLLSNTSEQNRTLILESIAQYQLDKAEDDNAYLPFPMGI